jgi:hypothetical protein
LVVPRLAAAALLLALLYFSPLVPLLDWSGIATALGANNMSIAAGATATYWQPWGYLPATIALGLMPIFLLGVGDAVERGDRRLKPGLVVAAVAIAWLHPWSAITALGVLGLLAARDRRVRRRSVLGRAVGGLAAPLGYYVLLGGLDPPWGLDELQRFLDVGQPPWAVIAVLAPVALAALRALRGSSLSAHERILRLWPCVALASFLFLARSDRLYALSGVALPLGVLAVRAWPRRLPLSAATAALVLLTVPGFVYSAQTFRDTVRANSAQFRVKSGVVDQGAAVHAVPSARLGG